MDAMSGLETVASNWVEEGKDPKKALSRSTLAKKKKEALFEAVEACMKKKGIRIPNNLELIRRELHKYLESLEE